MTIWILTPEGSKRFFEIMNAPNPLAQESRRLAKTLITPEQCAKMGKEPVRFVFRRRRSKVAQPHQNK